MPESIETIAWARVFVAAERDRFDITDVIGVYRSSDGARKACAERAGRPLTWNGGENYSASDGFLVMSTEVRP